MFDRRPVSLAFAVAWIGVAVAWLPLDASVLWVALAIAAAIAAVALRRDAVSLGMVDLGIALFCLGGALATTQALRVGESLVALRSILSAVVAFYLVRAMPGPRASAILAIAFAALGVAVALAVVILWAGAPASKLTPLNGWLYSAVRGLFDSRWVLRMDPANLSVAAAALMTPFAISLARALSAQRPAWTMAIGPIALAVAFLVLSVRSAWIAVVVAVVADGLITRGRALRVAGVAVAIAAIVVAAALGVAPGLFDPGSSLVRLDLWRASLDILAASGPLGLGPGMFPYHLIDLWRGKPGTEVFTAPDNLLLQLAGDAGALGLAGALVALVAFARGATRHLRDAPLAGGAVLGLLCYLAFGAVWSVSVVAVRTAEETFVTVALPFPWLLLGLFQRENERASP